MQRYPIKIKTMSDLQQYVNLFEQFEISGLLAGRDFYVEAYDVLELSTYDHFGDLFLLVKELRGGELVDLEEYLKDHRLMDTERCEAVWGAGLSGERF